MSKQLAISSALSVLLMASFVLFGVPAAQQSTDAPVGGLLQASAPALPAAKPALFR